VQSLRLAAFENKLKVVEKSFSTIPLFFPPRTCFEGKSGKRRKKSRDERPPLVDDARLKNKLSRPNGSTTRGATYTLGSKPVDMGRKLTTVEENCLMGHDCVGAEISPAEKG
jgi:hypothetical protein